MGILPGQAVTWKYLVINKGNVTLKTVVVTDNNGTPTDPADDITVCTIATLNVDASQSCSASGTAKTGWYYNLGTVNGYSPLDKPVSASDTSSYYGLTPGAVTNSSLCDFGDQFRLIFTLRLLPGTYLRNPYLQQQITGIAVGGSAKYGEGIFYIPPLQ